MLSRRARSHGAVPSARISPSSGRGSRLCTSRPSGFPAGMAGTEVRVHFPRASFSAGVANRRPGGMRYGRRKQSMSLIDRSRTFFRRTFRGLWRSRDFRKLWLSLTITSFGAQITNLALPLTAALLLNATPMQMGILIALETLPFALCSLHAGVLLDRVRKLPVIIAADIGRALALTVIPVAAWLGALSIDVLFVIGFVCGVQNVVGGAAYQVLIAQMAGRKRLVEANAKIALGETSAALIGPGLAGGLIQALTAPFAIAIDAFTFAASALLLRRIEAKSDVVRPNGAASVWRGIGEGLRLGWGKP